jgi:hypothetical protein
MRWNTRSWKTAPCRSCSSRQSSVPQATKALCSFWARCTISQRTGPQAAIHAAEPSARLSPKRSPCRRVSSAGAQAPCPALSQCSQPEDRPRTTSRWHTASDISRRPPTPTPIAVSQCGQRQPTGPQLPTHYIWPLQPQPADKPPGSSTVLLSSSLTVSILPSWGTSDGATMLQSAAFT